MQLCSFHIRKVLRLIDSSPLKDEFFLGGNSTVWVIQLVQKMPHLLSVLWRGRDWHTQPQHRGTYILSLSVWQFEHLIA